MAEQTLRDHSVDVVVNFAAESHNSLAVVDPGLFFRHQRARDPDAARGVPAGRASAASTTSPPARSTATSPSTPTRPSTEESPYRPRTPYNASKAGADHAVRAYYETYGLPVTITNCSNNYGPYQFPEKVIPLFTTLALDDQPLPLYASTANRREWIHVLDHCRAIERVIADGRVGETYHVGTGVEASIEQIADRVLAALGKPAVAEDHRPRPPRPRPALPPRLDQDPAGAGLAADGRTSTEGLADTVAWYADNRSWWEPLRGRAPVVESAWQPSGS